MACRNNLDAFFSHFCRFLKLLAAQNVRPLPLLQDIQWNFSANQILTYWHSAFSITLSKYLFGIFFRNTKNFKFTCCSISELNILTTRKVKCRHNLSRLAKLWGSDSLMQVQTCINHYLVVTWLSLLSKEVWCSVLRLLNSPVKSWRNSSGERWWASDSRIQVQTCPKSSFYACRLIFVAFEGRKKREKAYI